MLVIIKHSSIKMSQLILLQVQFFQITQPPDVSQVKSLEPVAFQLQAANREIATKNNAGSVDSSFSARSRISNLLTPL